MSILDDIAATAKEAGGRVKQGIIEQETKKAQAQIGRLALGGMVLLGFALVMKSK